MAVCFEPLTAEDSYALNGDDWKGARFSDVWKEWATHNLLLKLVLCDGNDDTILGIVRLGSARRISGGATILRDSLLETAPALQFRAGGRQYRGIGRVLVARLVVESKAQGAEGRVLVVPVHGSSAFYHTLGFRESRVKGEFRLQVQEAEALLKMCTIVSL